jgi:hypothetical protein
MFPPPHFMTSIRHCRQEHILQLVVAHYIKGIHNGFDQIIDVVWCLLVLKRLDHSEESEIEKKNI